MPLNKLPDDVVRAADRTHVWFNVVLGFCVALSIPTMPTWYTDQAFAVARMVPHSQAVWSLSLLATTGIYTIGSFMAFERRHRGTAVITGGMLCFCWYFGFALCMARESYVKPHEVNGLWPLVFIFIALLYGHRAVLYSNTFTGSRWALNPFQLYAVLFLMLVSLAQVIIGVSPGTVQAQFDRQAQISLAMVNMIGAIVCMIGLHLRDLERGLWIELWGYVSLTATMTFMVVTLIASNQGIPIATLGLTLSEAFVLASLHRAIQIATYKIALRRGDFATVDRMKPKLTHRSHDMLTVQEDPNVN